MDGAVLDVGLIGQVVRRLDGDLHPLDGEERCQVGRVRGDDDQSECPPETEERGEFISPGRSFNAMLTSQTRKLSYLEQGKSSGSTKHDS